MEKETAVVLLGSVQFYSAVSACWMSDGSLFNEWQTSTTPWWQFFNGWQTYSTMVAEPKDLQPKPAFVHNFESIHSTSWHHLLHLQELCECCHLIYLTFQFWGVLKCIPCSAFLGPNVFLSTLFSETCDLCFSFEVRNHNRVCDTRSEYSVTGKFFRSILPQYTLNITYVNRLLG